MSNAAHDRDVMPGDYNPLTDFYNVLGVPSDATSDQIRRAHRVRMKATHPDRGGSVWQAATLNVARDTLLDPTRRHIYDAQRASWRETAERFRATFARPSPASPTAASDSADARPDPVRLFTYMASEPIQVALDQGDWLVALAFAAGGRVADWLIDSWTSHDAAARAGLRQLGAQLLTEQVENGAGLMNVLWSQTKDAPSRGEIDLEALAASFGEVLRGEPPAVRQFVKPAARTTAASSPSRTARSTTTRSRSRAAKAARSAPRKSAT